MLTHGHLSKDFVETFNYRLRGVSSVLVHLTPAIPVVLSVYGGLGYRKPRAMFFKRNGERCHLKMFRGLSGS